jgi:ubiquinone/menaquinone biosynthesis C-methylase UbiE
MDDALRNVMLRYYDERASEYEDAYRLGTGTSSIADRSVFQREAGALEEIVRRFAHGRVLDLACGTGYWLQFYADQCAGVTLFDQSQRMLDECRKKLERLNIGGRVSLVHGDLLSWDFGVNTHDRAIVGFLLSHLTEEHEPRLFGVLRSVLGQAGRFLIMDSAWTELRARFNAKVERQRRRLNDGTVLDIYKRYLDRSDIAGWSDRHGVVTDVEYFGDAFFAVSGQFRTGTAAAHSP